MHVHCANIIRYKQLELHEQANTGKISLGKKARDLSSFSGIPKHMYTNSFLHWSTSKGFHYDGSEDMWLAKYSEHI